MALTVSDLEMLSKCDFVVLTLSSNYGRRVYEMMHNHHMDTSDRIISLDQMYYIWTESLRIFRFLSKHESKHSTFTSTNILNIGDEILLNEILHEPI